MNSDCKELLFEQERNYHGPISIHCYAINAKATQKLSYIYNQEKEAKYTLSEARKYLYDPDVSVLKAGAFKIVAQQYAVYKLHQHSHLYTSDLLIHDFIGRSFEVIEVIPIAHLKKQNPYTKAHVQSKNFPMKVDEIRKKFKIKDGTQNYLFFTTDHKDQLVCIACKKVVS